MSDTHENTQAVGARLDCHVRALLACPFCGGPPQPIATRGMHPYGVFPEAELLAPDGQYAKAFVFCHECGAEGEDRTGWCHDTGDVDALLAAACDLWNRRDQRNGDLYSACAADGLNVWPRPNARGNARP